MGKPDLIDSGYWEDGGVDVRLNPRREMDIEGLLPFLRDECGVRRSVVLATSGSSGLFKFVVLDKEALLASARSVAEHLGLTGEEVWLAGLSRFHVGGIGVYARAEVTGARVEEFSAFPWARDGKAFIDEIKKTKATWTSLTPTHLYDLMRANWECPPSMEGVLLGGGRMDPVLIAKARELGWPIRVSYGLTEASSQIATAKGHEVEWLPILDGWETKEKENGKLSIRGPALFSGYATKAGSGWTYLTACDESGWFTTGDRCEVGEGTLRFLGRADDLVKVSGELVSVSEMNDKIGRLGIEAGLEAAIVVVREERRENEFVLMVGGSRKGGASFFKHVQEELEGITRPRRFVALDALPRTEIGKIDSMELMRLAERS